MRNLSEQLTRERLILDERVGPPKRSSNTARVGYFGRRSGAGQFNRSSPSRTSRARDYGTEVGSGYVVDPYQQIVGRGGNYDKDVVGTLHKGRNTLRTIYGTRGPKPHFFGQ